MEPSGFGGNPRIDNGLPFFVPTKGETKLKPLGIALVCIAVLYGLDAYWFDGLYATTATHLLSQILRSFR